MIFRPGLYPINDRELELLATVIVNWCVKRDQYTAYVKIPIRGQPLLCRPVDDLALMMLHEAHLLPEDLFSPDRLFPLRPHLWLLE